MVIARDLGGQPEDRCVAAGQDLEPDRRVGPHQCPFVGVQLAGFAQDRIGNADLAGVVHRCGQFQQVALCLGPPDRRGQFPREGRHAPDMHAGIGIVVMAGLRQHEDGVTAALLQFPGMHQRQVRAHPGPHDPGGHRLDQVIDAARGESGLLVSHLRQGRDEDHRDVFSPRIGLERPTHRIPVHVGHLDVEQDERGPMLERYTDGLGAATGQHQAVFAPQNLAQGGEIGEFVVDDQERAVGHRLVLSWIGPGHVSGCGSRSRPHENRTRSSATVRRPGVRAQSDPATARTMIH